MSSDEAMSVESETDASSSVPLVAPLLELAAGVAKAAAAAASSVVSETGDEDWKTASGNKRKSRKKRSSAMKKREATRQATSAGGEGTPARTVERARPGATAVRPQATDLVVPATAFGGGEGPSRRVELEEVVARAEQLASEVRSGVMDPANKVAKSVASYVEERLAGIMSLLVAVTGRVHGLTGECVGLRTAHEAALRLVSERSGVVGSGPRPAALPGRPASFAAAVGAASAGTVSSAAPAGTASSAAIGSRPAGTVSSAIAGARLAPARRPEPRKPREPRHAVLIRAAKEKLAPAEVKARLVKLVNPGEASVSVTGVRTVPGGVIVETAAASDLEFFRGSEAIRAGGLAVTAPETPRRRIGVFAVPSEETEGRLLDALRTQAAPEMGEEDFRASVRVARRFQGRRARPPANNYVLEVTPEVAARLIARGRLLLGWHSCVVREYAEVERCFRCLGLGHSASSCRTVAMACMWCAGDGHSAAECPARGQPPCCVNCREAGLDATHRAMDGACPLYRAALENVRSTALREPAGSGASMGPGPSVADG